MCEPPSNPTSTLSSPDQLLILLRRSALPNPCSRRANLTFCTCLLGAGMAVNIHGVHIEQAELLLGASKSCARGPISVGWCWPAPSCWVVLARCQIGRDESFTSDNDQGVFEHLRLVDVLLVCTSTELLIDRVRGASRCVCLCFLSSAEMVGVHCWSWGVFECPCVSVVSGSFLMNKQHTRYTQSTPSHSFYDCRAPLVRLASPASSAGVHEAEVEGTGSARSQVTNVLPSCDGKRAGDTHGALS
jgi:hypothetical protein